ncbi:MAG: pilus assembly protein CpaE [Geminicoccaceae bacterium]|nr:pilus assembly protein CpaE [Geminicoccaceae bacterium]
MSNSLTTERLGNDHRAQFRAFIGDDETRAVVDQVIRDLVIPHAAVHKGGIRSCIEFLSEHRSPRILLVDLTQSDLPLSDINELAEVCEPGVTVVAIGDRNDVGLFRELMNQGISDYLVKPLTPALLQKSLLGTVDGPSRPRQTNRLGRLVVVLGSRGGVGSTMITANTAYNIAEVRRRRVALIDLDLHFGTIALSLDLEPSHGFREALETPSRIDGLYVDRTMVKYSDTFYVLSAEENIDETCNIDPHSIELLVQELRSKFHYVLVDLPRRDAGVTRKVLEEASNLVLVSDLSLSGMRDTLRILQLIPSTNASCNISLVLNRVGEHRSGEIPISEFEKGVGRKADIIIPFDPKNVASATNVGQPVVARHSLVGPGIDQLSEVLCGGGSKRKRGLIGRLMGKRAK